MKIKDLFKTSKNWVKCSSALDKNDEEVGVNSKNAVKFCLTGAINKCYRNHIKKYDIYDKIIQKLGLDTTFDPAQTIQTWNDKKHRKFEQVKKLVEKLDI